MDRETGDGAGKLGMIRQVMKAVGDFCFPSQCMICRKALADGQEKFCASCMGKILKLEQQLFCEGCARPLGRGADCPECDGRGVRPLKRIACLGKYEQPLRKLILDLKYGNRWGLADVLAGRMMGQDRIKEIMGRADCLVAVPMHWNRRLLRGYNQADLIARALGKISRLPVVVPVHRVRPTPSQTGIHSHQRRLSNMRGAFEMDRPELITRRHVVLVDDVMTSSATLRSVGRCLIKARPASLSAMVVAVADPRRQAFEAI